jgi:predicted DNA-binding ribbon-helix-helix protein
MQFFLGGRIECVRALLNATGEPFPDGSGHRLRSDGARWTMETGWMAKDIFLESRTVCVHGINKRLRLDRRIWNGLDEICEREFLTMDELATQAADLNPDRPLKAALETLAVVYYWEAAELSEENDASALGSGLRHRHH